MNQQEVEKYHKKWVKDNPDRVHLAHRRWNLKTKFGITLEQYNKMLKQQNGVCAICGKKNPSKRDLAVDHNHETKKVRGLLCSNCNLTFAVYEKHFAKMKKYLIKYGSIKRPNK